MSAPNITIKGILSNGERFYKEIRTDTTALNLTEKQLIEVDLSPLQQCTHLITIDLTNNQLTTVDLTSLQYCYTLEVLNLTSNQLTTIDLAPLEHCSNLTRIALSNNRLTAVDLAPLEKNTTLELLDLADNKLTNVDLSPLQQCKYLITLFLQKNKLTKIDLSPLHKCKYLIWLYLYSNRLATVDLSPLQQCFQFTTLDLAGNQLIEVGLSPLTSCPKIQRVALAGNQLSKIDLTPLQQCPNLTTLDLRDNHLDDVNLSPLKECSSLVRLYLSGNRFSTVNLSLLKDFTISNLEVLKDLYDLNPDQVISKALSDTDGCATLILFYQEWIESERPIEGKFWRIFHEAVVKWWENPDTDHWYSEKILESVKHSITSETLANYFIGSNDLDNDLESDYKGLRDEQRALQPKWFIELPLQMVHGEKFLKIRLNNLVWVNGQFKSYPTEKQSHPPISRMKVKIETRWHQEMEIDHIFYPNTEEERKQYNKDPNTAWLTDIMVMDLGNHLQTEENLVLTYSIECYFNAESTKPDFQTPTKKIAIPVIRTKNYQNVQKFLLKHNQVMTLALAIFSIGMSIITTILNYYDPLSDIASSFSGLEVAILGGMGLILIIGSLVGMIWLLKKINQEKLTDSVSTAD